MIGPVWLLRVGQKHMKEPFWNPSGVDLVEGIELGAVFLIMVLLENHRNNLFFWFVYTYIYIYTSLYLGWGSLF